MPAVEGGGGIFVSYRRQESSYPAGRLYDRLADRFGESQVFMDVDAIELGVDFAEEISRAVAACKVLLAVIGPTWLTTTDERGRRRLDDPDDIVRLEIGAALDRGVRVIPILVEGAVMPGRDDLPDSLAGLARRNALIIRHESFRSDAGRLVTTIERVLAVVPDTSADQPLPLADSPHHASPAVSPAEAMRDRRAAEAGTDLVTSSSGCDVAVLTAVPVETKALFEVLDEYGLNTQSAQRRGRYYDIIELPRPAWKATSMVVTQATDEGGQSASAVTHDVITEFRPQLVLIVGVCGGFAERKVALNDVIVVRNIFNYDPERVQPHGVGGRSQVYRTDEQLLRLVSYLDNRGGLNGALGSSKLHIKDYASGEKVIAWREAKPRADLLGLSTDLYGVETEAHGVMHAIWETFKADQFVGGGMIKCVSDLGDEEMGVDKTSKQLEAARKAARLALNIVAAFSRA